MASAKPPEKVIPVTHAKPWLEEKLRHVELKLAAVEDFEKVSTEEGFQERMLVLAKHRDEYTKQLETLNQEFSELFRDYAGFENPPVLESHPVLEKSRNPYGFLLPKISICSAAWTWKKMDTAGSAIGAINWRCWKEMLSARMKSFMNFSRNVTNDMKGWKWTNWNWSSNSRRC